MTNKDEHIKRILQQIPNLPGVYQYFDRDGKIIYVGKAKNLNRRVNSYFQKEHEWIKTRQLVERIRDIKYVVVDNEQDAFLLENNLIKQYQPHYNILLKDGKSYPSICITREPYPRIFKTRNRNKQVGDYYGPYSYGNSVDLVLNLIHELCPIRTCSGVMTSHGMTNHRYKTCLKYHLKKCCGICEKKIEDYQYTEYIERAKKIIRGDAHELVKQLEEEMYQLASTMKFEEASMIKEKLDLLNRFCSKTIITNTSAGDVDVFGYDEHDQHVYIAMLHVHHGSIVQGHTVQYTRQMNESKEEMLAFGIHELREQLQSNCPDVIVPFIPENTDENIHFYIATNGDKKKLLELAQQNVRQFKIDSIKQSDRLNPDQRIARVLGGLQRMLNLHEMPMWIDSFDNSNLQGSNAVASCVVFKKAKPSKKDYRKYIIKHVNGPDDYASMREIVRRRYQDLIEANLGLPDLIIADGGIGQMNAIQEVVENQLHLSIPIAGLKKDDKHRTNTLIYGVPPQEISLKVTDEVFRLLVQIQDEVHRFAITFHKKQRSKTQKHSQLDDIQGVGEVTKAKILRHFHSVERARLATLDEMKELLGNHLGSIVYEHFNTKISL